MISKRLKSIASFVSKNDLVVDIGCDHGLLSIYLYENKLCKNIIASDININALQNAITNIKRKQLDIKTIVSDGLTNIDLNEIDTIIISGMGTNTILHILNDKYLSNIKKIILQSNNDHSLLREEMNKKNFYLQDENIIYDNKKYYVTMLFIPSNKKNSKKEIKYGIIKDYNKDYYNYLISSYNNILKRIPKIKIKLRYKIKKEIKKLKTIIR